MKRLRQLGRFFMRLLRELSDEGAYRRHLLRHGRNHSKREWQHFCEHHLTAKYRRTKCC